MGRTHCHSTGAGHVAWRTVDCDATYRRCAGAEVNAASDLSDDGADVETEDYAATPDYTDGVGAVLVDVASCECIRECDATLTDSKDSPPFSTLPGSQVSPADTHCPGTPDPENPSFGTIWHCGIDGSQIPPRGEASAVRAQERPNRIVLVI